MCFRKVDDDDDDYPAPSKRNQPTNRGGGAPGYANRGGPPPSRGKGGPPPFRGRPQNFGNSYG